jgi:hypothetical protein
MTTQMPDAIFNPSEDMSRLVRITNAHVIDRSGVACAECGWLWPCPTRRMADGTARLDGSWYGTNDE